MTIKLSQLKIMHNTDFKMNGLYKYIHATWSCKDHPYTEPSTEPSRYQESLNSTEFVQNEDQFHFPAHKFKKIIIFNQTTFNFAFIKNSSQNKDQ